jgi:ATP-dependent DNA helicase RecQ
VPADLADAIGPATGEIGRAGRDGGPARAVLLHRPQDLARPSRERQQSKVELVRRYAEGRGCRRRTLLEVLGEARVEPCGNCDHCDSGDVGDPGERSGTSHGEPAPGETVAHDEWGRGIVQTVEDDTVIVLFDGAGYRTLSMPVVRERGLLTPV